MLRKLPLLLGATIAALSGYTWYKRMTSRRTEKATPSPQEVLDMVADKAAQSLLPGDRDVCRQAWSNWYRLEKRLKMNELVLLDGGTGKLILFVVSSLYIYIYILRKYYSCFYYIDSLITH